LSDDLKTSARFTELVQAFGGRPGVTSPYEDGNRRFGSDALKVNGSIFAMLTRGRLVVKLPQVDDRPAENRASRDAARTSS
jgi:hypothetical protein